MAYLSDRVVSVLYACHKPARHMVQLFAHFWISWELRVRHLPRWRQWSSSL